ncbi:MAG: type II secretion system protein [Phycisphaerales bacterium]
MHHPLAATNPSHRAFTVIELLAVVVILGLTAAVAGISLSGRSASAQLMEARSSLVSLDAAARIRANQSHTIQLLIDPEQSSLALVDQCCAGKEFARRHLSTQITIEAWDSHTQAPLRAIRYNARGHSTDYVVRISRENATTHIMFAGLTGWHTDAGGAPR